MLPLAGSFVAAASLVVASAGAVRAAPDPNPEPKADPRPRYATLPDVPAMPAPLAHGEVETGGVHIYYETFGDANGPPLLLLHGGLGNSEHWGAQLPALAAYHVYAIDSRGQGRSTRGKPTITYDLMAADVIAVMDQLGIARASVVGWSDGGEVALLLGIHDPTRVDKLVAIGVNYDEHGSKPRGSHTATFQAYSARCRADFVRLTRPANPGRAWGALVDALLPLWQQPMSFTRDQFATIQAPTLIADGDHDEVIVLDQEREMARLIPHGKLIVFENTSHFAMWQDPAAVNAAIVDFLGG